MHGLIPDDCFTKAYHFISNKNQVFEILGSDGKVLLGNL
jgi:hypothetical protein